VGRKINVYAWVVCNKTAKSDIFELIFISKKVIFDELGGYACVDMEEGWVPDGNSVRRGGHPWNIHPTRALIRSRGEEREAQVAVIILPYPTVIQLLIEWIQFVLIEFLVKLGREALVSAHFGVPNISHPYHAFCPIVCDWALGPISQRLDPVIYSSSNIIIVEIFLKNNLSFFPCMVMKYNTFFCYFCPKWEVLGLYRYLRSKIIANAKHYPHKIFFTSQVQCGLQAQPWLVKLLEDSPS